MAGEDDNDDEFSFPTTTHSPHRFIGSPRLWRSNSHSHHVHQSKLPKQEHEQEFKPTSDNRKMINLLSYIKKKECDGCNESMDVIWEDMNYEEEICGVGRRKGGVSCDFNYEMPEWGEKGKKYGEVTVACGGGRRRSMVVLVKVLKKLLLVHHNSRHWTVKRTVNYSSNRR